MILPRNYLEIYNPNKRMFGDRRKKVAWAVFSYLDENNVEYRKAFEAPINTSEDEMWKLAPLKITI